MSSRLLQDFTNALDRDAPQGGSGIFNPSDNSQSQPAGGKGKAVLTHDGKEDLPANYLEVA